MYIEEEREEKDPENGAATKGYARRERSVACATGIRAAVMRFLCSSGESAVSIKTSTRA